MGKLSQKIGIASTVNYIRNPSEPRKPRHCKDSFYCYQNLPRHGPIRECKNGRKK